MLKSSLVIRCWQCGYEEIIEQIFDDNIIDINLDKLCPRCNYGWLIKKELAFQKAFIPLAAYELTRSTNTGSSVQAQENSSPTINSPKMF